MSTLTKAKKRKATRKQLRQMNKDALEILFKKLDRTLASGCVPDHFMQDNYLLARAIMSSFSKDDPFKCVSSYRKEAANIHRFI